MDNPNDLKQVQEMDKPNDLEQVQEPVTSAQIEKAPEQDLDKIPDTIEPLILVETGHSEKYLLARCREHGLTLRQLGTLISMKQEYKTSLTQLFSMLALGLEFEEIHGLLQIRTLLREYDANPSLKWLWEFHQFFQDLPLDPDYLVSIITETFEQLCQSNYTYQFHFADRKIQILMAIAVNLKTTHLACVRDWLEYCSQKPAEKGLHEYPDIKSKLPTLINPHNTAFEPVDYQPQTESPQDLNKAKADAVETAEEELSEFEDEEQDPEVAADSDSETADDPANIGPATDADDTDQFSEEE